MSNDRVSKFAGINTSAASEDDPDSKIIDVMETFSLNRLGINDNRNYFVLDKNANCIGGSIEPDSNLDITPNIITAMTGETGDKIEIEGKVFSTAMGDAWIDITKLTVISSKKPIKVS